MLVARRTALVPATDATFPEISVAFAEPQPASSPSPVRGRQRLGRLKGGRGMRLALMLVPAVVAFISTSLLLYVLMSDRDPEDLGFGASEASHPESAGTQAADEPVAKPVAEQQQPGRSRFQVAPRYGLATSRASRSRAEVRPRPKPASTTPEPQVAPEAEAIDMSEQTAPIVIMPMAAPPQSALTTSPAPAAASRPPAQVQMAEASQAGPQPAAPVPPPPQQNAPPAPPETAALPQTRQPAQQLLQAAAPSNAPPPPALEVEAQPPVPQDGQIPAQVVAQWADPGLQPAQRGPLAVPPDDVLLLLIRSSLFALQQSNMTGDYNPLRRIASLPFQEANPQPKLFQAFANLRARNVDLSLAMMVPPKLLGRPQITPNGVLRVKGFFSTEPQRIVFDLMFMRGPQRRWRLFGISTDLAKPKKAAAQPGALSLAAHPSVAPQGPQQLAPVDSMPAAMPQASAESPPPLPTRRPGAPARRPDAPAP
jgi:hypothetical protein